MPVEDQESVAEEENVAFVAPKAHDAGHQHDLFRSIVIAVGCILLFVIGAALVAMAGGRQTSPEPCIAASPHVTVPARAKRLHLESNRTSYFIAASKTCFVAQAGFDKDGLGHQLHGRMSWIVVQELFKDRVVYVYSPLSVLEHSNLAIEVVESFLNIRSLFPDRSMVEKELGIPLRVRDDWEERFKFIEAIKSGTCDGTELWLLDNAWELIWGDATYIKDVENIIERSPLFYRMRRNYWHAPKPPLNFREGVAQVVIHVRRGDAADRLPDAELYYLNAIDFYMDYFAEAGLGMPSFIVETDDPSWPHLHRLRDKAGADNFRVGSDDLEVLSSFHRMVAADGFVAGYSSLSNAAVFYRSFSVPIIAPMIGKRNFINYFPLSVYEFV